MEKPGRRRRHQATHVSITHAATEANRVSPGKMHRVTVTPPEAGNRDPIRKTHQTNPKRDTCHRLASPSSSEGRFTPVQLVTRDGSGDNSPRHVRLKLLSLFEFV